MEAKSFFTELRQGWDEFRRQTWIWTTIVFFGIGNFAFASYWCSARSSLRKTSVAHRRGPP